MKRNLTQIRDNLRNATPLDAYQARLLSEMDLGEREALCGIGEASWRVLCERAKMAGFWHDDIRSPALPLDLLVDISGAA